MALFKRRTQKRPPWADKDEVTVSLFGGDELLEVKGESFHQDELRHVVRVHGREVVAMLIPEPNNPYDRNAVGVWVGGLQVGHLSREDAAVYVAGVARLIEEAGHPIAVRGHVAGGEPGKPSLGVFLRHDPEDFGVRNERTAERIRERNQSDGNVRTGSSAGNLYWLDRLPSDRLAAIKKLRELLASEANPMERHFMYLELEKVLYKARDVFDSALSEFEDACKAHDAEMDDILPKVLESGGIPALPTYKQTAIMKQKQHDYEAALWWAERGLARYGAGHCIRVDYVDDLKARVDKYRSKLG